MLHSLIAIEGPDTTHAAGAIVWWRLSGDVPHGTIAPAISALGMTPPAAPTPEAALRRALARSGASRGDRRLARRMDDRGRRLAVVSETAADDQNDLSYSVETRATLERVDHADGTTSTVLATAPHTPAIHSAYDVALETLTSDDVGLWLVRRAIEACDGISLRDTGGVYFLPRHGLPRWEALCKALRACSGHAFFNVPAYRGEDAVSGILDSLTHAVASALAAIEKAADTGLGERAADTKRREIESLRARVSRYEAILGTSAAGLHEACDRLTAHSAFQGLAAMAGDDPLAGLTF